MQGNICRVTTVVYVFPGSSKLIVCEKVRLQFCGGRLARFRKFFDCSNYSTQTASDRRTTNNERRHLEIALLVAANATECL